MDKVTKHGDILKELREQSEIQDQYLDDYDYDDESNNCSEDYQSIRTGDRRESRKEEEHKREPHYYSNLDQVSNQGKCNPILKPE